MEVIRTPDPDPFIDKWHPAIGHVKKDDKHKIECEVCHRYLKTFDLRVEHVKTFHPSVFYDCVFCPGAVLYTLRDLLSHCKETTLYVINATVRTTTRTRSRSTWSPNTQNSQHKQVRKEVHVKVLYVVNVACTVVQRLPLGFILLLIKRHHVHSVHRNSTMLPVGTSMSA